MPGPSESGTVGAEFIPFSGDLVLLEVNLSSPVGTRFARRPELLKILILALMLLLLTVRMEGGDRITGRPFATRSEVLATHGMAATSQPLATQIALRVMQQGGSAVDAAIAANAALGLMEPTGCGIGGDLFAIVWDAKSKKLHGLNASGRSPKSLSLQKLRDELAKLGSDVIPPRGVLPISVPGCVDGWFELHKRFGRLPMNDVLAPAISYAQDGFPVSELIAYYWQLSARSLSGQPGFNECFLRNGKPPEKGDILSNPPLARTYQRIAEGGRDAFYNGKITEEIVSFVASHGGFLTKEDFQDHRSEWVDPVSTDYRGFTVWELPPNGQGIATLQILNMMEGYPLSKWGPGSTDLIHHFIEAKKLAFEDRAQFYADPDFYDVPIARLLSKAYASEQRKKIDASKAALTIDTGHAATDHGDTVYLSVADPQGNMVSLIQSNYRGIGSGVCPPGLGFGLQDRGELFTLEDGHANQYAPGKRPFHTIIPGFVTREGEPWLSFGVMGGATQPQAKAWVLMHLIDFGLNLQEAGDIARVIHRGSSQPTGEKMTDGGFVSLESGISGEVVEELRTRGHTIKPAHGAFGGYQAVMKDVTRGVWVGASESRKDGQAAGW